MSGPVVRFGRYRTSPDADIAEITSGQQLAYVADATSQTLIVYRLGMWAGKDTGSPTSRIGLGSYTGSAPGALLTVTGAMIPTATMIDVTGGQSLVGDVSPVSLPPDRYAMVATSQGGTLGISMRQAGAITGQVELFWRKSGLASTMPTDPIGGTASTEGHLAIWAEAEANVAPNAPGALAPSGNVPATSLVPNLTATFSDANETLNNGAAFDRLERLHIQVVRVSDNAMLWDYEQPASSTEQANKRSQRLYAGSALAYNVAYTYRVRHQDRVGAWSAWASTTFTLQSLAAVERPTNPAGFETALQPGPITAVYRHANGLSSNAAQARLLASNGTVLVTGPITATTVAPNGTISLTWASTGIGNLNYGGRYGMQVRARDTAGTWGEWSPASIFWENAPPDIPTQVWPSGLTTSARPLLSAKLSDPDAEHPASSLTAFVEILNASNTVLATRTATYNAATGKHEYQTTSTDLASFATYRHLWYAYDGTLYSGGATSAASASRSGTASVVYAQGPTVTITAPSSPVGTTTPTVTWTNTFTGGGTKQSHRVRLYRPADNATVYDSGTVAGTGTSHTLSNANWIGELWNNGETFTLVVTVTDSNGLTSDSAGRSLTLSYTPPATLSLDGAPVALPGGAGTHAVRLSWQSSEVATGQFVAYEVWRVQLSGVGEPILATRVRLARITASTATALLDAEVTAGTRYRWELSQVVQQGYDTVASAPGQWTGSVNFDGLVLHQPFDPIGHVVHLRYGPADGRYAPELTLTQGMRFETTITSGVARAAFFAPGHAHDLSVEVGLLTDEYGTAAEKLEHLAMIFHAQNGDEDGRPHIVCWRDGRGGPHGRLYGVLTDPRVVHEVAGQYAVSLGFREVTFVLGTGGSS